MKALAVIPARGGSRRIPFKNRRYFHGKPIIGFSIEAAKSSGLFDRIIVSTDDRQIALIAEEYGAEAIARSEAMSRDEVGTQEVAAYVIRQLGYDGAFPPPFVCVIYPTCPMLTPEDLKLGLGMLQADPQKMFSFVVGTFYWGHTHAFLNPLINLGDAYSMTVPIPSERAIDINVEEDWSRAERMYQDLQQKQSHVHKHQLVPTPDPRMPELAHFRCDCGHILPT